MPRLIRSREGKTHEYELLEETTLGRSSKNTIRVPEGKASRQHARIVLENDQYVLYDLKSSNGTYVNGFKVESKPLHPGDEIRIGKTKFNFVEVIDDPLVGKDLGNYRVEERLGQGGMGAVYRAKQVTMDRDVALKVMRQEFIRDHNFIKDFMREARIAGRLHHPTIIGIHDFGQAEGYYFFSMEYVQGETLFDHVIREGGIDPLRAAEIMRKVAEALSHAHEQGVIHQDIKPENIMIADSGDIKVADLGLAKVMSYGSGSQIIDNRPVMGTPQYVAPEIVRRLPPDPRSDIYSLAATAFFMVTGKPPYDGDKPTTIVRKHLDAPVPDPRDKRKDLPPDLAEYIMRCMSKDPGRRPSSCEDMVGDLKRIEETIKSGRPVSRASGRRPAVPLAPSKKKSSREATPPEAPAKSETEPLSVNRWTPVAKVIMGVATLFITVVFCTLIYFAFRGGGEESGAGAMLRQAREQMETRNYDQAETILADLAITYPESPEATEAAELIRQIRDLRGGGSDGGRQAFADVRQRWRSGLIPADEAQSRLRALLDQSETSPGVASDIRDLLDRLDTPPAVPDSTQDQTDNGDDDDVDQGPTPAERAAEAWRESEPVVRRRMTAGEWQEAKKLLEALVATHEGTPAADSAALLLQEVNTEIAGAGREEYDRALTLKRDGRLDQAIEGLKRVARDNPGSPWADKAREQLALIDAGLRERCFVLWETLAPRLPDLQVAAIRMDAARLVESMQGLPWEQPARDLANIVEALAVYRKAFAQAVRRDTPKVGVEAVGLAKLSITGSQLTADGRPVQLGQINVSSIYEIVPVNRLDPLARIGAAVYFLGRGHYGYMRTCLESIGDDAQLSALGDTVFALKNGRLVTERFTFADGTSSQRWTPGAGLWAFGKGRLTAQTEDVAHITLTDRSFTGGNFAVEIQAMTNDPTGQASVVLAADDTHFVALRRTGSDLTLEYASGSLPAAKAETGLQNQKQPVRLEVADGAARIVLGYRQLATLPAPDSKTWTVNLRLEMAGSNGYFHHVLVEAGP